MNPRMRLAVLPAFALLIAVAIVVPVGAQNEAPPTPALTAPPPPAPDGRCEEVETATPPTNPLVPDPDCYVTPPTPEPSESTKEDRKKSKKDSKDEKSEDDGETCDKDAREMTREEHERCKREAERERAKEEKRKAAERDKESKSDGGAKAPPPARKPDGSPTRSNPAYVEAPAPGKSVPTFVIRKFRVPPFLLPIYQAAAVQYGVSWADLAAINEIETDYGRNLNVSSAGAMGWMQFIPSSWKAYGVDANKDGRKDPYNPVDAIFAAARYLKAAGYAEDRRRAIFAYNHADWYVDSVILRAKLISGASGVVDSLTGLTEGRFPVYAKARYADDLSEREAQRRVSRGENAAEVVESSDSRRGIEIYAAKGAPVVAVNDGVVKKVGESEELGRYLVLEDVYGNRFTYSGLGEVSQSYPVPRRDLEQERTAARAVSAKNDARPVKAASGGRQTDKQASRPAPEPLVGHPSVPVKERLFANPGRPNARTAGGAEQLLNRRERVSTFKNYFSRPLGIDPREYRLAQLKPGARVISGTILGRVGNPHEAKASHVYFEIRPAGKGAPKIDPKPILDGWKLLEATAIYRASGANALRDGDDEFSIGQILLLPKPALERRVLADERIDIYPCGRADIRSGQVNRRVLATLEYLAESGFRPSVSSLKCGHSYLTSAGGVSAHSSGNAVDIWKINGIPVLGHQENGGITEQTVRHLLKLQGTLAPNQLISLLSLGGPSFAMGDHADHIHVGFRPLFGQGKQAGAREALTALKPGQWDDLLNRLRKIDNPVVRTKPSDASLPDRSSRHRGD